MTGPAALLATSRRPDPPDLATELALAVATAEAAGAILLDAFGRPSVERRKGRHDVVTELDLASERLIMDNLAAAFPEDGRLGEETGWSKRPPGGGSGRTWIVDPLDGTINYAAGLPIWCVSIAIAIGPTVVLGVIRDAVHDATFWAIRGGGAWRLPGGGAAAWRLTGGGAAALTGGAAGQTAGGAAGPDVRGRASPLAGGEPLTVRRLRRSADAVVSTDPGAEADPVADARIRAIRPQVRAIRVPGSIAWSLTALASGRLDGVLQVRGLQAVDVAAAGLIASEAGARVTAADGGPWIDVADPATGRGIAAGRPAIHRILVGGG
jgi:myo-inositol-1(or 4)-monophosphatase